MSATPALIKRVESARGPDRGLDGLIARDIDGWIPHFDLEGDRLVEWPGYGGHWHRPKTHPKQGACKARSDSYPGFERECPAYTSSLDAAVSLAKRVLEPGDAITIGLNIHHREWSASVNRLDPDGRPYSVAWGQSPEAFPALALVLAVLRAVA